MDWVSKKLGLKTNATPGNAVSPKAGSSGAPGSPGSKTPLSPGSAASPSVERWDLVSPTGGAGDSMSLRRALRTGLKELSLSVAKNHKENLLKTAVKDTKLGVCVFGLVQALSRIPPDSESAKQGKLAQLQEKDAEVGISVFGALLRVLKHVTTASMGEIGLTIQSLIDFVQSAGTAKSTGVLVDSILKIGIGLVRLYCQDIGFQQKALETNAISVILDVTEKNIDVGMVERAVTLSKLVVEILKESLKRGSDLLDQFKNEHGYRRITNVALAIVRDTNAASVSIDSDMDTIVEIMEDLIYASRDDLTLSIEDSLTPYQHSDFRIPTATSGATISALESLESFKQILCIAGRKDAKWNLPVLAKLQASLGSTVLEVLRVNPINYFVMEKTRVFLDILQELDDMEPEVQSVILDIVCFVVSDLNYIPFKELVLLCEVFRGASSKETTELVCDLLNKLIDRNPKFKDVAREIGLVSMFGFMLQEYHFEISGKESSERKKDDKLQEEKDDKLQEETSVAEIVSSPTKSSPFSGEETFKQNEFYLSETILEKFETIMKICSRLLENPQNATTFRKSSRGAVYDLLADSRLRSGLLVQLVRDSSFTQSPTSQFSQQEISELNKLIEVLISAKKEDIELKLDVLSILRDALHMSPSSQLSFKDNGGFVALISTLLSLGGAFAEGDSLKGQEEALASKPSEISFDVDNFMDDDAKPFRDEKGDRWNLGLVAELVSTTFEVFIVAIQDSRINSAFVREDIGYKSIEDAIRLTGILNSDFAPAAFSGLLGIALENVAAFHVLRNEIRDISRSISTSLMELTPRKISFSKASIASINQQTFDYSSTNVSSASKLDRICAPSSVLLNTGIVVNVLNLLCHVSKEQLMIPYLVLDMILRLASCNRHNQVYMNEAGVLTVLFKWLFEEPSCWFLSDDAVDESHLKPDDAAKTDSHSHQPQKSGMALFRKKMQDKVIAIATRLIEVGISDTELRSLFHVMIPKKPQIPTIAGPLPVTTEPPASATTSVPGPISLDYSSQICSLSSDRHLVLLDLILHGLRHGRSPEYIHFNMHLNDYCCLSIPDFGRVFPPATGYTFLCWFQVERFDSKCEIPLLHMIDAEDKTRLRIIIESLPTSRKIRIETFKTTVRFETAVIKEGEWYHLAVVHQKPRMTASFIDVYLNGVALDHLKCGYLGHPGSVSKIRTYFGIPPEMALSEKSQSIWNIGPTHFIEETLMDANSVRTISNIGFEYSANFQGTFSKYHTHEVIYALSAEALNSKDGGLGSGSLNAKDLTQNATLPPSPDKASTPTTNILAMMLSQVKGTSASANGLEVSEDKILFSITAKNALEVRLRDHIQENNSSILMLAERLNPKARVLLSQSTPKVALDQNYSPVVTLIKGNPLFVCPQSVIDGIWKLGGCSILLMLVDRSETSEALYKSTAAVVESIRYNWRNTDDMERNEFYEILSSILSRKTQLLTIATIDILLSLIGRNLNSDADPVITNVTAVKHLFVDGFLWKAPFEIKKYFISQFSEFVAHSPKRTYNVRKLNRLGMTRKLLLLVHAQIITDDILPDILLLLKAFLRSNFSMDSVRSLCTFMMATLPRDGEKTSERMNAAAWRSRSNTFSTRAANIANTNKLHIEAKKTIPKLITDPKFCEGRGRSVVIRNMLLEVLLDLISDPSAEFANQFANIISSRWILLFFNKNLDVYSIVLATRILSRLCQTQNPAYSSSKFKEGFLIWGHELQPSAFIVDIFPSMYSILCGSDVSLISIGDQFNLADLLTMVKPTDLSKKRVLNPDALKTILQLIRRISESVHDENGRPLCQGCSLDNAKAANGETERSEMETRFQDIQEFLETSFELLTEMYLATDDMKEVFCRPEILDELVGLLFPLITGFAPISVEAELITQHTAPPEMKESTPQVEVIPSSTLNSSPEPATPLSSIPTQVSSTLAEVDRPATSPGPITPLKSLAKRSSLLGSEKLPPSISLSTDKLSHCISLSALNASELDQAEESVDPTPENALKLVLAIGIDSIIGNWKPLQSIDLILKATPPTTKENEAYFHSILLSHILNGIVDEVFKKRSLLYDSRVINNITKFVSELVDKVWSGTFAEGANIIYEFLTTLLEVIQQGESQVETPTKSAKQELIGSGLSKVLNRVILFQFSKFSTTISNAKEDERDITSFLGWVDSKKDDLTVLFQDSATKTWELYSSNELRLGKENLKLLSTKRCSKLKKALKRISQEKETLAKYHAKTQIWITDMQTLEFGRLNRYKSDLLASQNFVDADWAKVVGSLTRERSIWGLEKDLFNRWKLDFVEGRARMRKKLRRNMTSFVPYLSKHEKLKADRIENAIEKVEDALFDTSN
ncbi:hypothetical protein HDU97_001317 [Phlyctochytrium planicorne]|nr:hypothetical protein HDU97_001317 [Phlyctochytrium planicorne]